MSQATGSGVFGLRTGALMKPRGEGCTPPIFVLALGVNEVKRACDLDETASLRRSRNTGNRLVTRSRSWETGLRNPLCPATTPEPEKQLPLTSLPHAEGRGRMRKALRAPLGSVVFEAKALERGRAKRSTTLMALYMFCERGLKKKKCKARRHIGYSPGTGVSYPEVLPRRPMGARASCALRPSRASWGRGPGAVADSGSCSPAAWLE